MLALKILIKVDPLYYFYLNTIFKYVFIAAQYYSIKEKNELHKSYCIYQIILGYCTLNVPKGYDYH